MGRLSTFFVAICVLASPACSGDDDAASMLNAIGLNSMALRSFDAIVREEAVTTTAPGEFKKEIRVMRLCVDLDNSRALYLINGKRDSLMGQKSEPKTASLVGGMLWKDGKTIETNRIGKPTYGNPSFSKCCYAYDVPDFRFAGLIQYPKSMVEPRQPNSFEAMLATVAISNDQVNVEDKRDKTINISKRFPSANPDRFPMDITVVWAISRTTMMPETVTAKLHNPKANSISELYWESFLWQQLKGIYVPKRILSEQLNGQGEPTERTVYFHWFSVNEPIDAKRFSGIELDTLGKFHDALNAEGTELPR